MKFLITGANGYIGYHVVEKLLCLGHDVIASDLAFDNVDKRAYKTSVSIFSGDENIYEKLGSPDICVHLAWTDGFFHNSYSHMQNLSNHFSFIKNMVVGGLKHLAVMGTMHEVGYWNGEISESTPCSPMSFYGVAKYSLRLASKLLCESMGVTFQWPRAYYITGDDIKSHSIFTRLIEAENRGDKTFPFTTGQNKFDFLSIDELVNQIVAVITQDKINGIIECCSGTPVSLADKVEQFIKDNNFSIKLDYGVFPERPYISPTVWGDVSKIQKIL